MLQADDKLSIAPSFESTFSLVLLLLPHVCVFLPLYLLLYVCVFQATDVEHTGWPGGMLHLMVARRMPSRERKEQRCVRQLNIFIAKVRRGINIPQFLDNFEKHFQK
jgi:hypothetical protein